MQKDATLSWFIALLKNSPNGAEEKYEETSVRSPKRVELGTSGIWSATFGQNCWSLTESSNMVNPCPRQSKKKKPERGESLRKTEYRHDKRRPKKQNCVMQLRNYIHATHCAWPRHDFYFPVPMRSLLLTWTPSDELPINVPGLSRCYMRSIHSSRVHDTYLTYTALTEEKSCVRTF